MNKKSNLKGYLLAGALVVLAAALIIGIVKLQERDQALKVTDASAAGVALDGELPVKPDLEEQSDISLEQDQNQDQEGEALSPYLLDHLSFQEEEVKSVFAVWKGTKKEIPLERQYVILQSLRFTDMQAAATETASPTGQVIMQFALSDQRIIELPYNLDNNAFESAGKAYYADDQALLLMHGLMQPDSELGVFDAFEERARLEAEKQAELREPKGVEREQIAVDGLIYSEWEERLDTEPADWSIPYYDNAVGEVKEVRKYSNGILELNNKIIFCDGSHETPGGVKVGLTAAEVGKKLQADPMKLPSKWSYKSGDYFRFHLHFDGSKVKYMVLSQPL
ncbi:hypothetical protein QNH46_00555 [Paenibacillus woosongensis]|uniref:Uncharacterized protein n=1 Tax=Paenibacillus woosongensis TaxID=307580 RepID=A0AA95IB12_9BACL|nr:hypothetical protein [Paenibacillus woosongensis]WHX49235.1 hypothetical protein QNH46_00555 [Paenibacillus woosongensis]